MAEDDQWMNEDSLGIPQRIREGTGMYCFGSFEKVYRCVVVCGWTSSCKRMCSHVPTVSFRKLPEYLAGPTDAIRRLASARLKELQNSDG